VISWKKPLVDPFSVTVTQTQKEIHNKPTTSTTDLVGLTPGVYQAKRGAQVSSDGGRTTGNVVMIDGVQVQGTTGIDMAQGATELLEVISSGIPAKYGDVSGAVVNITSKGVSSKFNGSGRAQTSIDGYNNNLLSFSISGPLYKRKFKDGRAPEPVMGFALSGDYYNDHNRYPTYIKEYVTKGDVLKQLQANPFNITTDNSGRKVYNYASQYITNDQLVQVKQPPHNTTKELRLNGKVDYKVSNTARLTVGGMFGYTKADQYSRARNLFAPEATPVQTDYTGRGFIRYNQKFAKNPDTSRKSIINNASYSVQIDYQKLFSGTTDPNFGRDIFKYGYNGRFDIKYTDLYLQNQQDSATQKFGTVLFLKTPTRVDYTRSELNPILSNYTTQYYNSLNDVLPTTLTQIQGNNALINGDLPNNTYGMFFSTGTTLTTHRKLISNQYALTVDARFDLKAGGITHGIEFGLYYQQRIQKSFNASSNINGTTASLWRLMRQSASSINNGKITLDKEHPIFKINGGSYTYDKTTNRYYDANTGELSNVIAGPRDTITYNYINPNQTAFDKNLRKRLGIAQNADINVDNFDMNQINQLSLDLFSADELLNGGNPFVSYYGYGYAGQNQTGTVNFNDFWTQKDANGNYTRPIGAFTPNYIAGYIMDKFVYKDIVCNLGIRVDRYSANTKVLKDPYSLYQTKTINDTRNQGSQNVINGGQHPTNLGGDAVVYVDDNSSSKPTIIGYRSGNNWYDATGTRIEDPSILKANSGGRDPQPWLVDAKTSISDTNFNPNTSFTDYNPQVTVMPRLQISFPISQKSKFVAHYDIYVQRPYPTSLGIATAYDYYFLSANSNQIISNSNLRSQKTYDYELGFEQQVGNNAVLKINGFYKERKDMITVVPYLYAYPTTYYTYGNRDFSTTKGVKTYYEMRATNNLSMSVSYTLQFAEGTGSNPQSTNGGSGGQISPNGLLQNFIQAGLPNLRYVTALDVDSRHIIVANLDYRYADDEGPVIKGKHVFQNAGINFVARARSGEPYTRFANAQGNTIIGGINGSRLPWHFGADMRINKDFSLEFGKKNKDLPDQVKDRKVYKLSAFMYIQNLLNTREVLGVYGYTGKADDDGYLSSPFGRQAIPNQVNPKSYVDLYRIANNGNSSGFLNYARTINLGVEFNF